MAGRAQEVRAPAWPVEMAVAAALWDGLAAEWAADAPVTYPDGSAFPAARHLANLASVATFLTSLDLSETDDLLARVTMLMAMVRDPRRLGVAQVNALIDTLAVLSERGFPDEARLLGVAASDVTRYHEQLCE